MSAINAMPAANTSQNQIGVGSRSAGSPPARRLRGLGRLRLLRLGSLCGCPMGLRLLGFFLADRPRGFPPPAGLRWLSSEPDAVASWKVTATTPRIKSAARG